MKIIINTPYINIPAGVSNHYKGLKPYFSGNVIYNQCVTTNWIKRTFKTNNYYIIKLIRYFCLFFDVAKFSFIMILNHKCHVLLNPSFGPNALKREIIFAKIAKCFGAKYSFFIHGWTKEYFDSVASGNIRLDKIFYNAESYFVLAEQFRQNLITLGIKKKIFITRTKVPDYMIADSNREVTNIKRILYLARVEKDKGIFETIRTFQILHDAYPDLKFDVVGSGSALNEAKELAKPLGSSITFYGALYDKDVIKMYSQSDLYILLSYHEGMPTTVLEAMAFGLPVITRPVGGLVDFFRNEEMGYMDSSLDPIVFADYIKELIRHPDKVLAISKINREYAKVNFMASVVAKDIEEKLTN